MGAVCCHIVPTVSILPSCERLVKYNKKYYKRSSPSKSMTKSQSQLREAIKELSSMVDGVNIALERARELKERFEFNYEPFEDSYALVFALDVLIQRLRDDKTELETEMRNGQRQLK